MIRSAQSPLRLARVAWLTAAAVIAIGLLGVFLRAYFYGINRSLWIDEAKLALNIVGRTAPGLLQPLDNNQGAPVGFLLLEKAVVDWLGSRDFALRLIPFLAGVASIPLMWLVAQQFGLGVSPLLAFALFAVSDQLIYYASEVKQYSTDVLATLVLLLAFLHCLGTDRRRAAFGAFGLAGVLAVWLSHPSIFVAAGLALALGLTLLWQKDWRGLLWLVAVAVMWASSLAAAYFVSLRALAANAYLLNYWKFSFAPWPPWRQAAWYAGALTAALKDPAGLPVSAVTVGLLFVGGASLAWRRWPVLVAVGAPLVFTLVASGFQKYPFSGRLLLFAIPFALLLLAEGVERVRRWVQPLNAPAAWLLAAALASYLVYPAAVTVWHNLQSPPRREDIKPVMLYLSQKRIASDLIRVYYSALPAFQFYGPEYAIGAGEYTISITARDDPSRYLADIDALAGRPRVWFVFSHNCDWCPVNEEQFFLAHLNQIGLKREEFHATGASAYLYDLRPFPLFLPLLRR